MQIQTFTNLKIPELLHAAENLLTGRNSRANAHIYLELTDGPTPETEDRRTHITVSVRYTDETICVNSMLVDVCDHDNENEEYNSISITQEFGSSSDSDDFMPLGDFLTAYLEADFHDQKLRSMALLTP